MSGIPAVDENVLTSSDELINLPDLAEALRVSVTAVHQDLRDRRLFAVRRNGVLHVPVVQLAQDRSGIAKYLPGLITVLRDGGFTDDEAFAWLFTADASLPGRPVDAIHGHSAREVIRRAQALAL